MSVSSSKRMAAPMSVSSSKRMRIANHPQVVGQQPFVPQFQQRCRPSPFALNQAQRQVHPSQGHGITGGSNPIPGAYFPSQGQGVTGWSNPMPGPGAYFPPSACPPANQILDVNAFSGLISSLISRGLISFSNPTPSAVEVEVEGSAIGLKLDPQLLKVRHESAIRALYVDLPRQCKSCGLRFKCQEEHSRHMDWHVSRNRTNKNHLKHKRCRQWFATSTMWLSGAAETLPGSGFVPSTDAENKDHLEEMIVPADEDQTVCSLCGDRFVHFYSDETEDWMYKGAVYLNAPNTSTAAAAAMDRSQLGPIVHAKCK